MNHNTPQIEPDRIQAHVAFESSAPSFESSAPSLDHFESSIVRSSKSSTSGLSMSTVGLGLLAGIVGVASMTMSESFEKSAQRDPRTNAHALKLERLLRSPEKLGPKGWLVNHAMHWGQGAIAKILRPSFSNSSFQAVIPTFVFTGIRLSMDQALENIFRFGPAKNLSKQDQRINLFHKTIYAFATGFFADLLLRSGRRPQPMP